MCGACGVRPTFDWYSGGVPTDRVGRSESIERLGAVIGARVSEYGGRVVSTLAGTALLISSPSGGSRIASGVPDAVSAVAALFPRRVRWDPLDIASADGTTRTSGCVAVGLPPGIGWERFSFWFASVVAAHRRGLSAAYAELRTVRGAIAVAFDGAVIRATPVRAGIVPEVVRLTFEDHVAVPSKVDVLASLHALVTEPVLRAGK